MNNDEIGSYLTARYLGACLAVWSLFEFAIHQKLHKVYCLPVHLPDAQQNTWLVNAIREQVEQALVLSATMLTNFFSYNTEHQDEPACICEHFCLNNVFIKKELCW